MTWPSVSGVGCSSTWAVGGSLASTSPHTDKAWGQTSKQSLLLPGWPCWLLDRADLPAPPPGLREPPGLYVLRRPMVVTPPRRLPCEIEMAPISAHLRGGRLSWRSVAWWARARSGVYSRREQQPQATVVRDRGSEIRARERGSEDAFRSKGEHQVAIVASCAPSRRV